MLGGALDWEISDNDFYIVLRELIEQGFVIESIDLGKKRVYLSDEPNFKR